MRRSSTRLVISEQSRLDNMLGLSVVMDGKSPAGRGDCRKIFSCPEMNIGTI